MAARSLVRFARVVANATTTGSLCRGAGARVGRQAGSQRAKSGGAWQRLSQCVEQELALEQRALAGLPALAGFEVETSGTSAILRRTLEGGTAVKVQMDASDAIEVVGDEFEDEEGEGEGERDEEPFFVPVFSVGISRPQGDSLQFECSFDESGSYSSPGSEWDYLRIDSVGVVPGGQENTDAAFTADGENLSKELYQCLLGYLEECGVDRKFARGILSFHRTLEHRSYTQAFLEPLRQHLAGTG